MPHSDVIPENIDQLLAYQAYIVGGLRNCGVPQQDLDDRLQDVLMHCMASNFFLRVSEKVEAGNMNSKKFRAYLGATIHNLVVNKHKRMGRDPSIGALSADLYDGDDLDRSKGAINLSRYQTEEEASAPPKLPAAVIEKDIIRFVSERKPAFVPTLILWMQDYRPSDIARIVGKKKETIHYRMKALIKVLEEYFELKGANGSTGKISRPTPKITGPTYEVTSENPFQRGSGYHLWELLKTCGRPMSKLELISIAQRLMDQGKFHSKRPASEVVDTFILAAQDKGALIDHPAPAPPGSGGRSVHGRATYKMLTTENPYSWGGGASIFESVKLLSNFDFDTLCSVVQANLDGGQISSKRSAEDIAWGFIDTAKAYNVLDRVEASDVPASTVVATTVVATPVIPVTARTKPYKFTKACVFTRGINYSLWQGLAALPQWTREDAEVLAEDLLTSGMKSKRCARDLADAFYYHLFGDYPEHYEEVNPSV